MLYHNLLGNTRTVWHNVNHKKKLIIEQNCFRAAPDSTLCCPAKHSKISEKKDCPDL